jgi:hypothetical protein
MEFQDTPSVCVFVEIGESTQSSSCRLSQAISTSQRREPLVMVPRTLGLARDTENHLLMTEGSRYLKNRWLALHVNGAH